MDSKVRLGDSVIINTWLGKDSRCEWEEDFGKSFKVIGFAKDFSTSGFKNHWLDVSDEYEHVDMKGIKIVLMPEIPHFILDRKLSSGKDIIHPIFVSKDYNKSRNNKIDKLIDE
jgi:hypothetical protein